MTGCYKFVGRSCVGDRTTKGNDCCVHCGCPMGARSIVDEKDFAQQSAFDSLRRLERAGYRKHPSAKEPRIAEALKETTQALEELKK